MNVFNPKNLKEFFKIREANPNSIILAGGTDLLAQWHNNKILPQSVISIAQIKDLEFIKEEETFIEIGALTNHTTLVNHKTIQRYLPLISYAASTIGAPAIRNMGTIGGNIANASPAADLPPVLLIYDASLIIASASGNRVVNLSEFYRGYKNTVLRPDEIIHSIRISKPPANIATNFYKVGTRKAQSIGKLSLAIMLKKEKKGIEIIRLASGSVAPIPIRLYETEKFLLGKILTRSVISRACDVMLKYLKPITDVRSTDEYRRIALKNLLTKFLYKNQSSSPEK